MAARTDRTTDSALHAGLLLARRGQSYFSRKLNELSDQEFAEPSLLGGWTKAHLIAHVGLNARAITRLIDWASTGVPTPMYSSPEQRASEIDLASTLPAQALRNLSDHAAIHLNVEWRDLSDESWEHEVRTAQGRTVPASETVWMRTREVWIHAVDLGNGGSFDDFPPEFISAILVDVLANWSKRRTAEQLDHFVLEATDRGDIWGLDGSSESSIVLRGRSANLARWATGRGSSGLVNADGTAVPSSPRWL